MLAIFLIFMGLVNLILLITLGKQWNAMGKLGRITLAGVVFVFMPVAWGTAVVVDGVNSMKTVEFCDTCHVMSPYQKSLTVDDEESLPAIHYKNNWVPQKKACYDCHTEYSMFGGFKAKMNGLKHVWVNFVTGPPEKIELYSPYANRDCLKCHGPSKKFLEGEDHVDDLEDILAGELSCLECHDTGHVLEK